MRNAHDFSSTTLACLNLRYRASILGLLIFTLIACGGGGGDGTDANSSKSNKSAKTGIRVIHTALDLGQLDLYQSSSPEVLQTVRFAEPTFHAAAETGLSQFTIALHNVPLDQISSRSLAIDKNEQWSVVVFGNRDNLGLSTTLVDDSRIDLGSDEIGIRLIHGLVGAKQVQAFARNINYSDKADFGAVTTWQAIPAQTLNLEIIRTVDRRQVSTKTLTTTPRKFYSIVVAGELDLYSTVTVIEDER